MKSYFKGRPQKGYPVGGYQPATAQRIVPFRDFSTAHDPKEYTRQRGDLEGGRLDIAYDDGKPQPVKAGQHGKQQ
jgi:hypothetical protein